MNQQKWQKRGKIRALVGKNGRNWVKSGKDNLYIFYSFRTFLSLFLLFIDLSLLSLSLLLTWCHYASFQLQVINMFASYLNQPDSSNWFFPTYFGVSNFTHTTNRANYEYCSGNHLDEQFCFCGVPLTS